MDPRGRKSAIQQISSGESVWKEVMGVVDLSFLGSSVGSEGDFRLDIFSCLFWIVP